MASNLKLKPRETVPAQLVNFYVERDAAFVLGAEGALDKARVDGSPGKNALKTGTFST